MTEFVMEWGGWLVSIALGLFSWFVSARGRMVYNALRVMANVLEGASDDKNPEVDSVAAKSIKKMIADNAPPTSKIGRHIDKAAREASSARQRGSIEVRTMTPL